MSEKLCTLRGAGGGGAKQTETVLWTNPNPSSTFAAQTVTLSDSIDNYDYIGIKYAFNTELQTGSYISTIIAAVNEVKKWGCNIGTHHAIASIAVQNSSNSIFSRGWFYVSNTSMLIASSYQTGSTSSNNSIDIPLEIVGIKTLGGTSVKSQFKEVFICSSPGTSSDALASRGYELENAQSGDTLTGEAYDMTYLTATYTSGSTGYCQVTAKSDITAMVIKGYNTATYTVQNYTAGQLVGQCNRRSNDFLIIGVL